MANMNLETATAEKLASSISPANSEELKKVFDQFDTNRDGRISMLELGNVMKAMGTTYTEAELQRVIEDVDADRDGFISLEEFSAICCCSSSSASEATAELRDAFDLYDQDRNGVISAAELHFVLNRLGMSCSVDDCIRMIEPVDSDGDGNVNFEEFQKMMTSPSLLAGNSNDSAGSA